jgi:hypothetical protein
MQQKSVEQIPKSLCQFAEFASESFDILAWAPTALMRDVIPASRTTLGKGP